MREESQLNDPHTNLCVKTAYKVVQLTAIKKEQNQTLSDSSYKDREKKGFLLCQNSILLQSPSQADILTKYAT